MLRIRDGAKATVTPIELFFDLVFVFAITQLSHFLLTHLDPRGALEAALLFAALWWVWNYTAWVTNWLDPTQRVVRAALLALMLAGLALSTSLPDAFESRGAVFASAYVAMQLGRTLFMLWAVRGDNDHVGNFQRILCWTLLSGVVWLIGGFGPSALRLALWSGALSIDLLAPIVAFWTPFLGRANSSEWDIDAGHFAERCAGFVLIALGESVVVIGATFSESQWNGNLIVGFVATFVGGAAAWWIYFDTAAENARLAFERAADRGAVARTAYTYCHAVLLAGIVVMAVGDQLLFTRPDAPGDAAAIACIVGGPALFLLGNAAFRRAVYPRIPVSHLVGLAALALVAGLGLSFDRHLLALLASATLSVVAGLGMQLHAR